MSKMEEESDIELPAGTVPLDNQVAGHQRGLGSMVMLKCENGQIMKHVQPPPKGMREVEFYRRMFHRQLTDPVLLQLKDFIPRFHGTVPEGPIEHVKFFKMEDLTCNYRKPCIIDIKMGKFTFDPYASAEKRHYEVAKYPPVLNLGFQILGMRIYKNRTGNFDVYDRKYGRSLNEDQVVEGGLAVYFNGKDSLRKDVVRVVLDKMKEILSWFESQEKLAFYASSLLLIYEGETWDMGHGLTRNNSGSADIGNHLSQSLGLTNSSHHLSPSPLADVKMIDFAHVFDCESLDDNYLFGLRNLISHVEQLLVM